MAENQLKLRPEVLRFAEIMEKQLQANDHKPGWKQDTAWALFRRLEEEVSELRKALHHDTRITEEAADVANFAMMVVDVCGGLDCSSLPNAPQQLQAEIQRILTAFGAGGEVTTEVLSVALLKSDSERARLHAERQAILNAFNADGRLTTEAEGEAFAAGWFECHDKQSMEETERLRALLHAHDICPACGFGMEGDGNGCGNAECAEYCCRPGVTK